MKLSRAAALVFGVLGACDTRPSTPGVASALQEELGSLVSVELVVRVNGAHRPAGNGEAERYDVEYRARLVPRENVIFHVASGIERSFEKGARVKNIVAEFSSSSGGFSDYFNTGTESIPGSPDMAIPVEGTVTFLRTERGWQPSEVVVLLPDSVVQEEIAQRSRSIAAAITAAMRSDLMNLRSAQEYFYAEEQRAGREARYAASMMELRGNYSSSTGVTVRIVSSTETGFDATAAAWHQGTELTCRITVTLDASGNLEGRPICP